MKTLTPEEKSARVTYLKVLALVKNLIRKKVNTEHPIIADEGVRIINEYAEKLAKARAIEFGNWLIRNVNKDEINRNVVGGYYKMFTDEN